MPKKYQTILSEELRKKNMKGKTKKEREKLFKEGVRDAQKKYKQEKQKN